MARKVWSVWSGLSGLVSSGLPPLPHACRFCFYAIDMDGLQPIAALQQFLDAYWPFQTDVSCLSGIGPNNAELNFRKGARKQVLASAHGSEH